MASEFGVRAAIISIAMAASAAHGAELEGVQLDDRVHVDGHALQLNGMALRTWFLVRLYVAGLYLPQKATRADVAINSDGPKRIVLVMMRDATADQFCEFIEGGIHANNDEADLKRVRAQTESLYSKIRAIGEARAGTRIVLDYASSAGATTLIVDGAPQGEPMHGAEFFRALLRIWLGERPAQPELKRMLLGVEQEAKE
jgi:chalcone isomerase-like protein